MATPPYKSRDIEQFLRYHYPSKTIPHGEQREIAAIFGCTRNLVNVCASNVWGDLGSEEKRLMDVRDALKNRTDCDCDTIEFFHFRYLK